MADKTMEEPVLRRVQQYAGVSDLARRLGYSRSYMSQVLNERIPAGKELAKKLAEMGVKVKSWSEVYPTMKAQGATVQQAMRDITEEKEGGAE